MHRETEYVSCKALDIPRQWHDWDEVADAIVEECLSRGPLEVGIQPERRVTIELREQAPAKGDFLFDEGDVILITGGARGVTATVAEMLAKAFRPRLVLLGRSPLPDAEPTWLQNLESETELKKALFAQGLNGEPIRHPRELNDAYYRLTKNREILGNLHKLREAGASVHYYSVDVRDTEAISKLVKQVHAKHGPVRGLIHAAGVLEDRKILDKTPEQFDKVFSTKVQGLRSLLEALGSEPLKAMLLFSSVSGRIGNQGQVDYAMANEVLNKVAQHQALIRPDCRVLAANWGPWAGGMVTPELKRHFEKQGVELIPLEAGARAMLRELRTGNEQDVEVVYGGMFHDPEEPAHRPSYTTMEGGEASHGSLPVDVMQDEWQLVKEFVVSPESFPILKAHRIGEHEVVPLALMMEWIGLATQTTAPELSMLGYENVRVLKGIRLREEPIRVFVMAGSLQKIAGHYQLPLEIRSVTSLQSPRVHLRGRAILGEHALPPLPEKKKPSSQLWKDSYPLSIGESYEKVLFHGKELQGLLEIRGHSPQGMRFSVSTAPEPSEWSEPALQEEWLHDPLVMDCAFQAAILWCYAHKDMASLPTFFSSFRQFSAPIVGPIDVVLEVDSASRHKMKGSFSFWNAEGQLLARMRGYECAMNPALLQRFHNP
jgi:NAD(P)-dependent dehydrogenase (short-subunit alcohol dehydrogenase family)